MLCCAEDHFQDTEPSNDTPLLLGIILVENYNQKVIVVGDTICNGWIADLNWCVGIYKNLK